MNRPYCFKLRSDLIFTNIDFLKYFDKFKKRDKKYEFFKSKVIIPSVFTKLFSHVNGRPVPYHPTDWWFFGYSEDIKKYFDVEFANDENYFNWKQKFQNIERTPYPTCQERYFTEQYFFIQSFSKKFDLKYDDLTCWNDYNIKLWENLLVNNFIVLDTNQHGIYSLKYPGTKDKNNGSDKSFRGLCWHDEYKRLYIKHFCPILNILKSIINFFYKNSSTKNMIDIKICAIKIKHKIKNKKISIRSKYL